MHQPDSQGHPRTRRDRELSVIHLGSVERRGCHSSRRAGQQPAAPGGGARVPTAAHELCLGLQQSWTQLSSPPGSPSVLQPLFPDQGCSPQSAWGYQEQKHPGIVSGDAAQCLCAPQDPPSAPAPGSSCFPSHSPISCSRTLPPSVHGAPHLPNIPGEVLEAKPPSRQGLSSSWEEGRDEGGRCCN